jgi:hypothetical protein
LQAIVAPPMLAGSIGLTVLQIKRKALIPKK